MKSTPGPWNTGTVLSNETRYTQPIFTDKGRCLGEVYGNINHSWTDEHRANARLIAAAPDLLEACKYAQTNLEFPEGEAPNGSRFISAIERLQQAIAKAEGGNP